MPRILVFDSGLGGLTVFAALKAARPDADLVYLADGAAFPYGRLPEVVLVERVAAIVGHGIATQAPDVVVIACNTASTLVMPVLRERFSVPFVGTVPAIKPAAHATTSRIIGVLATPGTVRRDYTRALVDTYASHCAVFLHGAASLAELAEMKLGGQRPSPSAILKEIRPVFRRRGGKRTDVVVLGCTHFPLLSPELEALAPWPVTWIDPAPAIARQASALLGPARRGALPAPRFLTTAASVGEGMAASLKRFGIGRADALNIPLAGAPAAV